MKKRRLPSPAVILAALALFVALGGTATAVSQFGSGAIKDGSIRSRDIHNGSITKDDLDNASERAMRGFKNLETDGPYPGVPSLDLGSMENQGDNSDSLWAHDGSRQTSWVECAPGKVALGGGFNLASDAGDVAAKTVQVVVSEPTQVEGGKTIYDDGSIYHPIPGDEAGSFVPNGWLVQGFNTGTTDVVVRPWVICADITPGNS